MRPLRRVVLLLCILVPFTGRGADSPAPKTDRPANPPSIAEDLRPLQGHWEGFMVGDERSGKITITVTNDLLHFHRDTNFWFKTTISVPPDTDPRQFLATIKDCPPSQASSVGEQVLAIFKVEDRKLTVATGGGDKAPKSFDPKQNAGLTLYELRKAEPRLLFALPPWVK